MGSIPQTLIEQANLWAPRVVGGIVVILAFFIAAKITKRIIIKNAKRLKIDSNLTLLLARASSIALIIFGIITALGTLGVDISALVTGLGLTGFAIGFALKDTISNFLSGILILLYRPFEVGHRIKISGYEGIVISIDLRYTELDSDGNKILIPNSKLFTDPITVLRGQA